MKIKTPNGLIPLKELGYLPKGIMDPHELDKEASRAGKLPSEILKSLASNKCKLDEEEKK